MTRTRLFLSVAIAVAISSPAAAQMYPGEGVTVNPGAVTGGRVLLYPGGKAVRVEPRLLQPGQPYPGTEAAPIQLHMPTVHHRRAVVHRETPAESVASAPEAPPKRSAPIAAAAPEEAAPPQSSSAIPFSFGGPIPARQRPAAVKPPKQSRGTESIASVAPPPVTTSSAMTPGEEPPNLSKRSEISFPHNGTDPTPEAQAQLKQLAGDLNSALDAGARRVQLDAFGGAPGDKSSDARRVSLRRALVVRQLLINAGVPASRIDVRAMGGIDDNGNADRVDVYVRAG